MTIFVGSKNPVKVAAVKQAINQELMQAEVEGFDVASGVGAQPRSDRETRQGAEQRARAALLAGMEKHQLQDDALGTGLEGGVFEQGDEMWMTVWCAVVTPKGKIFACNGSRFLVPSYVADGIRGGREMGDVVSEHSGIENLKQKQGLIGIVTHGYITRTEEYAAVMRLALGLWYGSIHP